MGCDAARPGRLREIAFLIVLDASGPHRLRDVPQKSHLSSQKRLTLLSAMPGLIGCNLQGSRSLVFPMFQLHGVARGRETCRRIHHHHTSPQSPPPPKNNCTTCNLECPRSLSIPPSVSAPSRPKPAYTRCILECSGKLRYLFFGVIAPPQAESTCSRFCCLTPSALSLPTHNAFLDEVQRGRFLEVALLAVSEPSRPQKPRDVPQSWPVLTPSASSLPSATVQGATCNARRAYGSCYFGIIASSHAESRAEVSSPPPLPQNPLFSKRIV